MQAARDGSSVRSRVSGRVAASATGAAAAWGVGCRLSQIAVQSEARGAMVHVDVSWARTRCATPGAFARCAMRGHVD